MLKKVRHFLSLKTIAKHTGISLATIQSYSKWERTPSLANEAVLKKYLRGVAEQIKKVIGADSKKPKGERINRSDFEQFWEKYPRKIGKKAARIKYQTVRKEVKHEAIMNGLERYNTEIRKKKTEIQYIAHPSTWLNQWRRDDEFKGTIAVETVNQSVEVKPKEVKREMTDEEKQRAKKAIEVARQRMRSNMAS